jgi:hypothetical protein
MKTTAMLPAAAMLTIAVSAPSQVVLRSGNDSGFLPVVHSSNAGTVAVGDSGTLTPAGNGAPIPLSRITLHLSSFSAALSGTADIELTIHDGDPSGLGPGSGAPLYTTTVRNAVLEAAAFPPDAAYFDLVVPLSGAVTLGGANHVGWSVRCSRFNFGGELGFQVGSCSTQYVGQGTRKAAWFNGSTWSQFDFGNDPCTGFAQLAVTIERAPPCEGDLDGNRSVDAGDIGALLLEFGSCQSPSSCPADLDRNGGVDAGDIGSLLLKFGACAG